MSAEALAAAEALLAEVVEGGAYVYEGCFVDEEEAVVELDGLLDR